MCAADECPAFQFGLKIRNILMILVATGLFLLKRRYSGPFEVLVHSYGGNILVSFAIYFNFLNVSMPDRYKRLLAVLLTLLCVESFELLDGFGLMANTYDMIDLLANAIGVGCAYGLEKALSHKRPAESSTNAFK